MSFKNSWAEKIRVGWRDLILGIQNLIIWFPTIWRDRYWDYVFLLTLMHKKLELMERGILKNAIHVDYQKDAFKIKRCRLTLKRLIDQDLYHRRAKLFPHNEDFRTADRKEKFDLDYLFSQMKKHIRGWWD